jgi:hypothetical protein
MFLVGFLFTSLVRAEGYYCPYTQLGASESNQLLYDYYNGDSFQGYWTRTGQTGWQSISEYCRLKGDTSVHSDAGEWKCNDSRLTCIWNGNSCGVNPNRLPDCLELCQAVLNNEGPQCLGNCPGGGQAPSLYGNPIYDKYCPPSTGTASTGTPSTGTASTGTPSGGSTASDESGTRVLPVTVTVTAVSQFSYKGRSCGNNGKKYVY